MSRIQQLLAKAERDGTARRAVPPGDAGVGEGLSAMPPFSTRDTNTGLEPVREAVATPDVEEDETPNADTSTALPVDGRPALDAVLSPLLVAAVDPHSQAAEQYRSLRTRIGQSENGQAIRVIQVTSPGKHECRRG